MPQTNQASTASFSITPEFGQSLKRFNSWGKFISIMSFVFSGLAIIGSLVYFAVGFIFLFTEPQAWLLGAIILAYALFVVFMSAIGILMGLKLWQASEKINQLQRVQAIEDYQLHSAAAISLLHSYFKYQGIAIIFYLVLIVIVIIGYTAFLGVFITSYPSNQLEPHQDLQTPTNEYRMMI